MPIRYGIARGGVLVALSIGIACFGDTSAHSYRVVDSAGVRLVSNGNVGAWITDSAWYFREDLRLPSTVDKLDKQLGQFGSLAVNGRGEIFVLDVLNPRLLHYDSSGKYLRTIGRPGVGPGEFGPGGSTANSVLIGAADSILVSDIGNLRISVFTPQGRFVRAIPISLEDGPPKRWDILPGGGLVEQVQSVMVAGQDTTTPGNALLLLPTNGAKPDTLLHLPVGDILDLRGGLSTVKTRLLYSDVMWDIADDGRIIVAESGTYRILVYDSSGALRMIMSKPAAARPVSTQDRSDVLTSFKNALIRMSPQMPDSQMAVNVRQLLDNVDVATTYPAFAAVRAGPDGAVLVRHVATIGELKGGDSVLTLERMREGSPNWDVFDRDGRFLGVVRFPSRFQLTVAALNGYYGVLRDSLDVPSIVRLVRNGGK